MRGKKAIYNIITNLILQIITIIYGFIVPKIIITKYGSNVNGLVTSITQFLGYITLLEAGFGPVVKSILYKPIAEKNQKEIASILRTTEKFFRKISIIFIAYIIGLSFLYPLLVNNDFGYLYTVSLIIIISISTFAQYYFGITYQLFLQADQKTYVKSSIQIATYFFSIIAIVVMALTDCPIHMLKLISGLIFVLRPFIQNFYVKKKYRINFKDADENYKIKSKMDGLAQHISYVIHNNTDVVLLTIFNTLENVSIYAVYNMIISGINTIIRSFSEGISASFGDMIAKNEKENLKRKFGVYETLYMIVATIAYSCVLVLIIPFVKIYTKEFSDANYIQPFFAYLFTISFLLYTLKNPYNDLANDAGHFKEMKKGAIIEAVCNVVISIILVHKYNLVGVAIGTLVAMLIRLIHLIMHVNKDILYRSNIINMKKIVLMIIEMVIIVLLCNKINFFKITGYFSWILNAFVVFVISSIITLLLNTIFYRDDLKGFFSIIINTIKKKGKKNEV